MEGKFVDGISEDRLLNEEHIAARLFNLFAEVEKVLTLFFENLVHLAVVIDNDLVVHLFLERSARQKAKKD